ncbi:RNA polymerase factor sigma-54 [Natroniella sulfidigena]|uniref:RNA polymerase factor sigma-54 n=1 Tax=Natroniella sulfidigena TaxID=723921 RepID=UPI00200B7136|nr:RNA polymerase factor sigma-54 [Natroniella sulfidigena]MCK8816717.1 RNA polymerase factor sigma-54 [Natroniella sulfidigena]
MMELNYGLDVKQEQQLVMTPKLQQAIELLQLSSLELKDYIDEEMLENPLLELEDDYDSSATDYANYTADQDEFNYENFVAKELTLDEYLRQQLKLVVTNSSEEEIGKQIIGNLDQSGFFNDTARLATELEVAVSQIEVVLEKIKRFDPIGIATSGMEEALLTQLEELKSKKNKQEIELAKEVVDTHLEEVSKNQVRKIAKSLKIKPIHAQQVIDLIKTLDPVPANKFRKEITDNSYIEPDIVVRKVNDRYVTILNDFSFPTLRISKYYKKLLAKNKSKDELQGYMEEKLESALWLVKSIEQRRRTVYNIVQELIDVQHEFLEKGLKYLKPLTMKEVAERIEMHESTVSRATSNKYIQTPYGLFSMKFLFSGSIKTKGGQVSAVSVKQQLQEVVDNEDPNKPLSDQKISQKLAERGIDISRRTVAKYRKELKIPSSRMRKRYN